VSGAGLAGELGAEAQRIPEPALDAEFLAVNPALKAGLVGLGEQLVLPACDETLLGDADHL